jgi:transcriptional regulator with XRE-family HTH domain
MFGMNLREYRQKKGLTQEALAEQLSDLLNEKYAKINVGKWETGTNPKIKVIIALAELLDIPEQYLFDNHPKKISKIIDDLIPNFENVINQTKKVPLLDGYVGAGSGGIIDNLDIVDYLYIDINSIKRAYKDENIHALTVVGDSMIPYVDNQDIILFTKIKKGQYNLTDGKYIIQTINGIMVKNLSFKTNGDIVISSCNIIYPPEVINQNETQESLDIIGIVVGRYLKN